MQISASTFSDPAMREQLQQYYENKKAALYETLKSREPLPETVSIRTGDGQVGTVKAIPISAEKMVGALVSFDKWLELQAKSFENPVMGPKGIERAQEQIDRMKANSPDSPSEVRSTFSSEGSLLAYVNADGGVMISNAAQAKLQPVLDRANSLGLAGEQRISFLNQEIGAALAETYPELKTSRYDGSNAPSKRQFAQMWYPSHDVDSHYDDAMAAARDHFDSVEAWHKQWQGNMNDVRSFLLGLQEA